MHTERKNPPNMLPWKYRPPVILPQEALKEDCRSSSNPTVDQTGPNRRIKVRYENEVKMVMFSNKESLNSLKETIRRAFDDLQRSDFTLRYEDSTMDFVTVASDVDLAMVLEECSARFHNVPRFTIHKLEINTSSGEKKVIVCKHYQAGWCRYGSTCKFVHEEVRPSSSRVAFMFSFQIEGWLSNQMRISAADNIEYLSSSAGLEMLQNICSGSHLSANAAHMLTRLLTKEELRTSMLKQDTNKIYGCLLGSTFLMQLQMHINNTFPPTAESLKDYLYLIEEVQLRTSNGWKHVPLDTIRAVLEGLPPSQLKTELLNTTEALVEHRRRVQLRMASPGQPDECLKGGEFRSIPIIPSIEELLTPATSSSLPVNKIGLPYTTVVEYLETQFRLLREDFIDPLRKGVKEYRENAGYIADVRIYAEVKLYQTVLALDGVLTRVTFQARTRKRIEDWKSSKRLMSGALLCITSNRFQTILWGTVANRDNLETGVVDIKLLDGYQLEPCTKYVMVESTAAYFEAYSHVLSSLQKEDMERLPFAEHLISLQQEVKEPAYLSTRAAGDVYDFSTVFPGIEKEIGRSRFCILRQWPDWSTTLDTSQRSALKHALTKRLALVQGPPGTGKTFVGLLIVRCLLSNLNRLDNGSDPARHWRSTGVPESENEHGPILVVCYTNHALDQFLECIYKEEKNLIRVGGGSKSKVLEERSLNKLLYEARERRRSLQGPVDRARLRSKEEIERLEKRINHCIGLLRVGVLSKELLQGVATENQISNLFFNTGTRERMLESWLQGARRPRMVHFQAPPVQGTNPESAHIQRYVAPELKNKFDVLVQGESEELLFEEQEDYIDSSDDDGSSSGNEEESAHSDSDEEEACSDVHLESDEGTVLEPDEVFQSAYGSSDETVQQEMSPTFCIDKGGDTPEVHGQQVTEDSPLHTFIDHPDLWSLPVGARRRVHNHWLDEIHARARADLSELRQEYTLACQQNAEADREIRLSVLRKARVVGMTTTGAARLQEILGALRPKVVIVEEAAEVLESHILACLSPYTEHLILIGDHLQLRPSIATYKLSVKNKLDVSLFERLVQSGMEHSMLQTQRRMKPCISKLICHIYPSLKDHPCVSEYEDIKGMKSSLHFLDHKAPEEADNEGGSKKNITEARFIVELCAYLLNQDCYTPKDITILAMYKAQVQEINTRLKTRLDGHHVEAYKKQNAASENKVEENNTPRVTSVDDFQGEENDIVILSLVRSNVVAGNEELGSIGFLSISNRVCVALSRARKGLYIFGNAELLKKKSPLWGSILKSMQEDGVVGGELIVRCQNHPDIETKVSRAEDFNLVGDGGCSKPCEYQLNCGHVCPRRCHPGNHDAVLCPKRCYRQYENCEHRCEKLCHGDEACPPCPKRVVKTFTRCGHKQSMECPEDPEGVMCRTPCEKLLACGHKCRNRCGQPCQDFCREPVLKKLSCGHEIMMSCSQDPSTFCCTVKCDAILDVCEHPCKGTCGECKQGTQHIDCKQECGRIMVCGHKCKSSCSAPCPPCPRACEKRCVHSKCQSICGMPCKPCREPCAWKCKLHCHEVCQRRRCNRPCRKRLPCKHKCIGLCGEPCPDKCRKCNPDTFDVISQMPLHESDPHDRFVQLRDCGHLFEVSGLDQWMDMDDDTQTSTAILLKSCPECKTPVRRTYRYANVVKAKLQQIEQVKKQVYSSHMTNQGYRKLERKDYKAAEEFFGRAISLHPGQFEAHLGIASTFCAMENFAEAIAHLRLIIQNSPLDILKLVPVVPTQHVPLPSRNVGVLPRAQQDVAIRAAVQLASALTGMKKFNEAIEVCGVVLKNDINNQKAMQIKKQAEARNYVPTLQELRKVLGGIGGQWYTCPNGHVYIVGECGRPMETSSCPECHAQIGGLDHNPVPGNQTITT